MLTNKIYSASKLIGDLLMPALLTKDPEIQKELVKILKTISCMSFGTYTVILDTKDKPGHLIFENDAINISVVCSKCNNTTQNQLEPENFLEKVNKEHIEIYSESNLLTPSQHATVMGLRSLIAKFLNWKHYTDLEDSGFWSLLETQCNHFYVFDYGVTSEIVKIENTQHLLKVFKPFLNDNTVSNAKRFIFIKNHHQPFSTRCCI